MRDEAGWTMDRCLSELIVNPVKTTARFHRVVRRNPGFQ